MEHGRDNSLLRAAGAAEIAALSAAILGREPVSEREIARFVDAGATVLDALRDLLQQEEHERSLFGPIGYRQFRLDPANAVQIDGPEEMLRGLMEVVRRHWRQLGEQRPHWSVMTNPAYLPENLDQRAEEEFYWTGSVDIDAILKRFRRLEIMPDGSAAALDFGCGIGRLAEPLSKHFANYVGVDCSEHHLRLAAARLELRGRSNAALVDAETFLFSGLGDMRFGCIVSLLTLQHNPPPLMLLSLKRILGALAPSGTAYVQLPVFLYGYQFDIGGYLARPYPTGTIEMHALPQHVVIETIREAGHDLVEVVVDGRVGSIGVSNGFVIRARP